MPPPSNLLSRSAERVRRLLRQIHERIIPGRDADLSDGEPSPSHLSGALPVAGQAHAPQVGEAGKGHGRTSSEADATQLRYQQLFESSPLPLWVYDLETLRFLDVNEVACAKYGFTRDEFLSMTILDIRPPEDVPEVLASVRDTPRSVFNSGVWRHRLKSGQIINVEITSHEMWFMGRLTRFVCPIDVTQRMRAEAFLRRRDAALRRAQTLARLAHVLIIPEGQFEDPSDNLALLVGVAPHELPKTVDRWGEQLVHPDDRANLCEAVVMALATEQRVDVEYRLCQTNGNVIRIAQVFDPVEGVGLSGERRWLSTMQDVTEQKLAEDALVLQAEKLEARVRQRTAELEVSNRELMLATEQAQQSSLAKSRFLSTVSHELRTPLNAILGFAQLMGMPGQISAAQHATFLSHIVQSGQHLLALINELLDLAAIEAGKTSMAIEALLLPEILADCELLIRPIAAQRNIEVHVSAGTGLAVMADRTRLKQVLINLLSNAVKYSPDGARVDVQHERFGESVRIAVVDRGIGMTAQQLAALYQPFNRLGREGSETQGTGIGLVVTKSLIELMGGQLGVESHPGAGSTFWIELPFAPAMDVAPSRSDSAHEGLKEPSCPLPRRTSVRRRPSCFAPMTIRPACGSFSRC